MIVARGNGARYWFEVANLAGQMMSRSNNTAVQWQLALVVWGDKYPDDEVNTLIDAVMTHASHPPRVVMITDRPRAGVHGHVERRSFPEFFNRPRFLEGGCQAKLALFAKDVLPDDLPTIFLDIDTMVLGDLTKFLPLQKNDKNIVMFHSAGLPFGALARFVAKITNKRFYARGNSSLIVFHPAQCGYIAQQFEQMFNDNGASTAGPLKADERFISWVAQIHMDAVPKFMAVKFPTEFMLPFRWLILLRGWLPWNIRRWDALLAVTFPGMKLKGQDLMVLPNGAEIVDQKGRRLIWSSRALGPMKDKITAYYQNVNQLKDA